MKKALLVLGWVLIAAACNNNNSKRPKIDTTPNLSQTNNALEVLVDTLGFHTDSATDNYEKGSLLITKSDCVSCHKTKESNAGPSYVAIATKYPATPENIKHLSSAIINGSKGVWGNVPMKAYPNVSQQDATEMAKYILSLKDVK